MTPKELKKMDEESTKIFGDWIKPYLDSKLKEQAEQFHEYLIKYNLPVHKDFFKIKGGK